MVKKDIVVGMLVQALKYPVEGSKVYSCTVCKQDVWVSKALQPMSESGAEINCLQCSLNRLPVGNPSDHVVIAPKVLEELSKLLQRRITQEEANELVEEILEERRLGW